LDSGEPVSPWAGLRPLGERTTAIALYCLFLALVVVAWVRLVSLPFAIKFDLVSPSVQGYLGMVTGGGDLAVVLYALVVSLMLAGVIFVNGPLGIVVIFPVLAYATWHSYRATVR
jgi:uncharacterized membrane protein